MDLIIHRGTHQIGGCVTEVRTANTRVFLDFGAELPGETPGPGVDGLLAGPPPDAVLFTHNHGDHIGLLDALPPEVPAYLGPAAKEIYLTLRWRLGDRDLSRVEALRTFTPGVPFQIGDLRVTPLLTDHSAYDAYMFLLEGEGRRILHTGDFRTHGFRGKAVLPTLARYAKGVDALLLEGTALDRPGPEPETERQVQQKARALMERYRYLFLFCSSTNIDRLAGFYHALPRGRYFFCDRYQRAVLAAAERYGGVHTPLYTFPKALTWGKNLADRAERRGFCFAVRPSPAFQTVMEDFQRRHPEETAAVYSLWRGYLDQTDNPWSPVLKGFSHVEALHTSGHAGREALGAVCGAVRPGVVIPLHTRAPERLEVPAPVRVLEDGEVYRV